MKCLFKNASALAVLALVALGVTSCSKEKDVAGGVTDIGNSVAEGLVVSEANQPVPHARVVAYYDGWDKTTIEDSVEVQADENGKFSLKYDSTQAVVLYAETDDKSGLSRMENTESALVMVGHPRSIADARSGYVRIVGSNDTARVNSDGSFAFDAMPVGEISLVYVADEQPRARFDFMTTVMGDTLKIPELEELNQNDGWLTISDYRYYSGAAFGGIMVSVPEDIKVPEKTVVPVDTAAKDTTVQDTVVKDTAEIDTLKEPAVLMELRMDGADQGVKVYDNDGSVVEDVNYVEGVSGKAILLEVGQYIEVGKIDLCVSDFTMSAWIKWGGYRGDGIYQILFAERSDWNTGLSRFQLQYEIMTSSITAVGDGVDLAGYGYAWLSKGNVERGGKLPMNEWAHVALVYESGKLYFYINGKLASAKEGIPFEPKDVEDMPFRIGGSEIANDTWNGPIDEVYIESTAHNAEWVKAQYEKFAK